MNQDSAARLTVPTALLALLHTDAGQPYQRFRPAPLLAAAELAYTSARELGTHASVDERALAGASISVTIDGTYDFTC